jgi:amidase
MGTDEIIYAAAGTIATNIRRKIWSSTEVVEAHLRRIACVNPQLNAVVELTADRARAEAQAADRAIAAGAALGPLHGVPMTIKDNLDTAGVVSTGGTLGRRAFIPAEDATVVARLRAAGAILLGKTNTPELTLSFETDNLIHGRTSNPYDLDCTSGGSSGGAAAIIAAGGSPFDIGSDTGGSIRLPAHFCGIAGLRPTSGRVSRTGHILPPAGPLDALTQLGPMARFVDDLDLLLPIISGSDWSDPAIVDMPLGDPGKIELKHVRVAFHTDNGIMAATQETMATVAAAARALIEAGAAVEEERPAALAQTAELWRGLFRSDGGTTPKLLLEQYGTTEPHPWLRPDPAGATQTPTVEDLVRWHFRLGAFRSAMLGFMQRYDAILCPVCAFPAIPHDTSDDADKVEGFNYTKAYNLTGWPGAVVRCGTSATGLPIGVQIVARPWREDVALAIARHLEGIFGGWRKPPL